MRVGKPERFRGVRRTGDLTRETTAAFNLTSTECDQPSGGAANVLGVIFSPLAQADAEEFRKLFS
jgi:hypothetical protein